MEKETKQKPLLSPTQIVAEESEKAVRTGIKKMIDQKLAEGVTPEELLSLTQQSQEVVPTQQITDLLTQLTSNVNKEPAGAQGALMKLMAPLQKALSGTTSIERVQQQNQKDQLSTLSTVLGIAKNAQDLNNTPQKQFQDKTIQDAQKAGFASTGNLIMDQLLELTRQYEQTSKFDEAKASKTAQLEAQQQFDQEQGKQELESFTDQFELAVDELFQQAPEALDQGFGGYLARIGADINSSRFIDELPELRTLKNNIEATATPLAKLAGEDRLTNEDIDRFLKTLVNPTKQSLRTNISQLRFQSRKLKKQGKNVDVFNSMIDRLEGKLDFREAIKEANSSGGTKQVLEDENGNRALVDLTTNKVIREL